MSVNWFEKSFQAWSILCKCAKNDRDITYVDLGKKIDVFKRNIQYVLGPIQAHCLDAELPRLTIFAVSATSGMPSSGFAGSDSAYEEDRAKACNHDWDAVENPFKFAHSEEGSKSLEQDLLRNPAAAEQIYRLVESRGVRQCGFRNAVRKAYGQQCAFTGLSFKSGLDACHIVPWGSATEQQKIDPRNGILLNSFHHRLFDAGVITINADYEIVYIGKKPGKWVPSQADRDWVMSLSKMRCPKKKGLWPLPENILQRNKLLGLPVE